MTRKKPDLVPTFHIAVINTPLANRDPYILKQKAKKGYQAHHEEVVIYCVITLHSRTLSNFTIKTSIWIIGKENVDG